MTTSTSHQNLPEDSPNKHNKSVSFEQEVEFIPLDPSHSPLNADDPFEPEQFAIVDSSGKTRWPTFQYSDNGVLSLRSKHTSGVKAVMDECHRQRHLGISDPELLATVYHGYSIVANDVALRRGRLDTSHAVMVDWSEANADGKYPPVPQVEFLTSSDDDSDDISVISGYGDTTFPPEEFFAKHLHLSSSQHGHSTPANTSGMMTRIKKVLRRG